MPLVSVITPVTRFWALAEAMESVKAQTVTDIEHLWAHDTSHIGPGFLRNRLVKEAKGEWLVFLDDDDLLDPDFVECHLKHAIDNGYDLVYSLCRYPPGHEPRPEIGEFDEGRLRWANYIPMTVLLKKSWFDRVGGFGVSVPYEDWQLWIALLDAGAKFGFLNKICWTYRLHGHPWRPE